LVLRQMIQYDWCFPAERKQLSVQFDLLGRMDAASFDALMASFSVILLSPELREMDWVDHPQQFSEQLTAYLWSQQQIDRYHEAAQGYQEYLTKSLAEKTPPTPRWTSQVAPKRSAQQIKIRILISCVGNGVGNTVENHNVSFIFIGRESLGATKNLYARHRRAFFFALFHTSSDLRCQYN
jgi:hypothetical protein